MFEHARSAPVSSQGWLEEACGVVVRVCDGGALEFRPLENVEHSATRYSVRDKDVLGILNKVNAGEWELLAIFHSHTHTAAEPSSTDVDFARGWPDQVFLIASLRDENIRAFRIVDGKVDEDDLSFAA
ncbi:MAG: Mov34/MPN/PAD-1 family protein [Chloroflexi bacterium]|nr:Mov34/MPN/PAD-1 family protein [Chloroflexota bacterium]